MWYKAVTSPRRENNANHDSVALRLRGATSMPLVRQPPQTAAAHSPEDRRSLDDWRPTVFATANADLRALKRAPKELISGPKSVHTIASAAELRRRTDPMLSTSCTVLRTFLEHNTAQTLHFAMHVLSEMHDREARDNNKTTNKKIALILIKYYYYTLRTFNQSLLEDSLGKSVPVPER